MSLFNRGGAAPSLFDAQSVYVPAQDEDMDIDEAGDEFNRPAPMKFEEFKSQRSNAQVRCHQNSDLTHFWNHFDKNLYKEIC